MRGEPPQTSHQESSKSHRSKFSRALVPQTPVPRRRLRAQWALILVRVGQKITGEGRSDGGLIGGRCGRREIRAIRNVNSMRGEVVEDHRSARCDPGDQILPDIGGESRPIHGALDHPWCDECVSGQPGDQSLGAPTVEWRIHGQPLTLRCPTGQAGQVDIYRCFIQKHEHDRVFERWQANDAFSRLRTAALPSQVGAR